MRIFKTYYRWSWGTAHLNIRAYCRDFYYGVQNLVKWLPLIWHDRDWDWEYLAKIMEFKLRNMSKGFARYGTHSRADKDARDTLICAELLKRLIADNDDGITVFKNHIERMESWEKEFGRIIGKKMRYWWD